MKEDDKKWITILKEHEFEKASEPFSSHLKQVIIDKYQKEPTEEYAMGKWLGKFILAVLIFFNLLFFYYLNPFAIQLLTFISICAFVLGFWILIGVIQKKSLADLTSKSPR